MTWAGYSENSWEFSICSPNNEVQSCITMAKLVNACSGFKLLVKINNLNLKKIWIDDSILFCFLFPLINSVLDIHKSQEPDLWENIGSLN